MHTKINFICLSVAVFTSLSCLAADRLEIRGIAELHGVYNDAEHNWLDGGFSITRYDNDTFPLRLGKVGLNVDYHISDTLWLQTTTHFYQDGGATAELEEAYFHYRPIPKGPMRLRARIGAFHLPISLENRDIAWTSRFSTTPSVINSWIGEDLRSIGAEFSIDWPGRFRQSAHSWKLTGAAFGFNDANGTILDHRGWANHDRQTGLFSALPLPTIVPGQEREIYPFYENDDSPGYYVIGEWQYLDKFSLQFTQYDNLAQIGVSRNRQSGWRTAFKQLAAEWRLKQWLLEAQLMDGNTLAFNPFAKVIYNSDFTSFYLLANRTLNRHSLTARLEYFSVDDRDQSPIDHSQQNGRSMMLSWQYLYSDRFRFGAEWLLADSDKLERLIYTGRGHELIQQLLFTVQYRFKN